MIEHLHTDTDCLRSVSEFLQPASGCVQSMNAWFLGMRLFIICYSNSQSTAKCTASCICTSHEFLRYRVGGSHNNYDEMPLSVCSIRLRRTYYLHHASMTNCAICCSKMVSTVIITTNYN